jgi:hypothetical protein
VSVLVDNSPAPLWLVAAGQLNLMVPSTEISKSARKNTCLDHYYRTLREQTEQMIKPLDFQ